MLWVVNHPLLPLHTALLGCVLLIAGHVCMMRVLLSSVLAQTVCAAAEKKEGCVARLREMLELQKGSPREEIATLNRIAVRGVIPFVG